MTTPGTDIDGTTVSLDKEDRELLRLLQADATLPLGRLAEKIEASDFS